MARAYVTIAAHGKTGRLYTGVTGRLESGRPDGAMLVWVEEHPSLVQARRRGAAIRRWKRACKIATIERVNPGWKDLSAGPPTRRRNQTPR